MVGSASSPESPDSLGGPAELPASLPQPSGGHVVSGAPPPRLTCETPTTVLLANAPPSLNKYRSDSSRAPGSPPAVWFWQMTGVAWDRSTTSYRSQYNLWRGWSQDNATRGQRQRAERGEAEKEAERKRSRKHYHSSRAVCNHDAAAVSEPVSHAPSGLSSLPLTLQLAAARACKSRYSAAREKDAAATAAMLEAAAAAVSAGMPQAGVAQMAATLEEEQEEELDLTPEADTLPCWEEGEGSAASPQLEHAPPELPPPRNNEEVASRLLALLPRRGLIAPLQTTNELFERARSHVGSSLDKMPMATGLGISARGGTMGRLAHLRGDDRVLECSAVGCSVKWPFPYAARAISQLQRRSSLRHLFYDGAPGAELLAILQGEQRSWTCFTCATFAFFHRAVPVMRQRAFEQMALRGWSGATDFGSLMCELSGLELPAVLELPLANSSKHTFVPPRVHLVVLNGAKITCPTVAVADKLKTFVADDEVATTFDRAVREVGVRGETGEATIIVVACREAYARLISEGAELRGGWDPTEPSALRALLADTAMVMPVAALRNGTSPVSGVSANRIFTGAQIIAKVHSCARQRQRRDGGVSASGCAACLRPGVALNVMNLCRSCAGFLSKPIAPDSVAFNGTKGGRVGPVSNPAVLVPHLTTGRYFGQPDRAIAHGSALLPPDEAAAKAGVVDLVPLVPATPNSTKTSAGDPVVSRKIEASFRSLSVSPQEHDFAAKLVPEYASLRKALANQEFELLLILQAVCPLSLPEGEFDYDARISRLTSAPDGCNDGESGFIAGYCGLELEALKYETYEELLEAAIKPGGYLARRNCGTYLSEDGCGTHFDQSDTHEVVIEVWAGDVCALPEAERIKAMELAERLAGRHGARVLLPDARISLRVRPCCDVMIAHLKAWQHLSINHPVFGRHATAVHVA